jgi:hypothetical protein
LDPAAETDCGEACCSIALLAFGLDFFSPGCVRQAMSLPQHSGFSTADDLASFLEQFRLDVTIEQWTPEELHTGLIHAAESGGLAVVLGAWVYPDLEHWQVSGRRAPDGLWFSDPWTPGRVERTWAEADSLYAGVAVTVHAR